MYALYTSEAEFTGPLFKTVDDAHNYVFNNRSILIPLKEKKTTLMSLQVIYDENLKVHVDKRSSVQQPEQPDIQAGPGLCRSQQGGEQQHN